MIPNRGAAANKGATKSCQKEEENVRIGRKYLKMGGFQRAGTGKNKKVTEISPLLAFWSVGQGIKFL